MGHKKPNKTCKRVEKKLAKKKAKKTKLKKKERNWCRGGEEGGGWVG